MNVRFSSFCFFFLSLQVSNSRTDDAPPQVYRVPGGRIIFRCSYEEYGTWKFFCKEKCEGANILVQTHERSNKKGRYSIEYSTYYGLSGSISELTQSDSGLYRLVMGRSSSFAPYCVFRVVVAEALLNRSKDHHFYKEAGSSLTVACSLGSSGRKQFCRGECGEVLVETYAVGAERGRYNIEYEEQTAGGVLYVTIRNLTQSDSGRYRCKMVRYYLSHSYRDFDVTVRDAVVPSASTPTSRQRFSSDSGSSTPSGSSKAPSSLYLLLVVGLTLTIIILLLSVALLVFCRKRSAAAQRGTALQTENTAANQAEDDLDKLGYAEVNFSKRSSDSPLRASAGNGNNVVYATVRMSDLNRADDEPLYSNTAQL